MTFCTISNLINKLFNAQKLKKKKIIHPKTKNCLKLVYLLKSKGFILGFSCFKINFKRFIKIFLKYRNSIPSIGKIKIISKPSKRIYLKTEGLSKFNVNNGFFILHTTRGLLTDKECRFFNIGGEVLIFIA